MQALITQLTSLDYVLLVVAFLSVLIGFKRGFVREIISLLIWVIAFVVAVLFTGTMAQKLGTYFQPQWVAEFIGFIVLLVVVLFVGKLVGMLLASAIGHGGAGALNYLLGGLLGLLRGIVIAALIIFILSHTFWKESKWFKASQFAQRIQTITRWGEHNIVDRVEQTNQPVEEKIQAKT
jgi:membrane protein required for colicin V production